MTAAYFILSAEELNSSTDYDAQQNRQYIKKKTGKASTLVREM